MVYYDNPKEYRTLEHYIEKVISETLIPLDETKCLGLSSQYVEVEMIVDCYGIKEMIQRVFLQEEWDEYKKQRYFTA